MTESRPRVEPENTAWVFGVALVLVVMAGLAATLVMPRYAPVVEEGKVAEIFGDSGLPFGLELHDVSTLPSGDVVVRLVVPEEESAEGEASEAGDTEQEATGAERDETLPIEVLAVEYAKASAVDDLFKTEDGGNRRRRFRRMASEKDQEASRKMGEWEEDPSFDWHTTVQRGWASWRQWRAKFAVEREFREGGGWSDSLRVNLVQADRNLVVFAKWPDGVEMPEERMYELLRSVVMLPEE